MNLEHISEALRGTVDPSLSKQAEAKLKEMQKIIGFAPAILTIVDNTSVDGPTRQAGAIYLKNLVLTHWNPPEHKSGAEMFLIHDQDKHEMRERLVDSLVKAPTLISNQLATCCQHILEHDFPARWPTVVDKVVVYLNEPSDDASSSQAEKLHGALIVLYRLVKNYEYKKESEREPLTAAMKIILPVMLERMTQLLNNQSQEAVLIKKLMLKILFALVQFSLSLTLMPQENFMLWMEYCRHILEMPVPEETLKVDAEDRPELIWWKCKKWAAHLLHRIFERYGNPTNVSATYTKFAKYYVKNCAPSVIKTILSVFARHQSGEYLTHRVIFECLMYLSEGTANSESWKCLKNEAVGVIQNIVFPLLCHDEEDGQLWEDEPQEYIRLKYDMFEEIMNPAHAGTVFINKVVKRKGYLAQVLHLLTGVLTAPGMEPQKRDGALHMVGALSEVLTKKKQYKSELESMLVNHIFPVIQDPSALHMVGALSEVLTKKKQYKSELESMLVNHIFPVIQDPSAAGFLRSRACWVVKEFAKISYSNIENLRTALLLTVRTLADNSLDLPIRMEAAMAVKELEEEQERAAPFLKSELKTIITSLLDLIALTKSDELCTAMNTFIQDFMDDIIPVSVEIANHLVNIFVQLMNSTPSEHDDSTLTATAILATLETVLDTVDEHPQIMMQLEEIIRGLVTSVFEHGMMDFYEEMLTMIYSLTCSHVSQPMWAIFDTLFGLFGPEGGVEYFTDMMPALHNYVTVDTDALLSDSSRPEKVLTMCRQVFDAEFDDEDNECHAAKMIEVVILQCKGKIDQYIQPIMQLILGRLAKPMKTSELRTMCLQVLIAVLHYNTSLFLQTMQSMQPADSTQSILDAFVTKWLDDTDCFLGLHDRKMCILGLMILVTLQPRPNILAVPDTINQILPSCILLFDGLKRAYESQAEREKKQQAESDEDEESIPDDDLNDDEDEIDEDGQEYLEMLAKQDKDSGNGDEYESDNGEDDDFDDENIFDNYETPLDGEKAELDEYILFKDTLQRLEGTDPEWLHRLCVPLTPEQQIKLQEIFALADKRKAAIGILLHRLCVPLTPEQQIKLQEIFALADKRKAAMGQFLHISLHRLCVPLTPEQQIKLQEIFALADKRKAAIDSRLIEDSGGYQFAVQQVPTAFNFGH